LRRLGEWQVSSEVNRFHRGLGALGQFFSGSEPLESAARPISGRSPGGTGVGRGRAERHGAAGAVSAEMRRVAVSSFDGRGASQGGAEQGGAEGGGRTDDGAEGGAAVQGSATYASARYGIAGEGFPGTRGAPVPPGATSRQGAARPPGTRSAGHRPSRQVVLRRRRVLAWLAWSLAGSFLLGAIPWFRALWDLSLVVLCLSVAYLASLAYVQRRAVLAAERATKVVRLQAVRSPSRLDGDAPALAAVEAVGLAAAGGGGGGPLRSGDRPVVVALPRRPSFVLVDAPT